MTRDEFDNWLDGVHAGCFPGVAGWLRKMDASERAAVLAEWFNVLRFHPLPECEQASRELWNQESEPKGFGKHPIIISRMLRKKKHEREHAAAKKERWQPPVDGEPTYKCLECRDEGIVQCFHPKTVDELKRALDGDHIMPCTVGRACGCDAGNDYRRCGTADRDDLRTTYRDADGMLCWRDVNDPGDRAALIELAIGAKAWN